MIFLFLRSYFQLLNLLNNLVINGNKKVVVCQIFLMWDGQKKKLLVNSRLQSSGLGHLRAQDAR